MAFACAYLGHQQFWWLRWIRPLTPFSHSTPLAYITVTTGLSPGPRPSNP